MPTKTDKELVLHPSFVFGVAAQHLGRERSAMAFYRSELRRSRYFKAHFNLAWLLTRRRRFREAAVHYRAALAAGRRRFPLYDVWLNLGSVYSKMDRPQEAMAAYRRARRLEPKNPLTCLNIADLYFEAGNERAGRAWLERGVRNRPGPDESDQLAGYLMVKYTDRIEEGIAVLRPWLKREAVEGLVKADTALGYARIGKPALAYRFISQARAALRRSSKYEERRLRSAIQAAERALKRSGVTGRD